MALSLSLSLSLSPHFFRWNEVRIDFKCIVDSFLIFALTFWNVLANYLNIMHVSFFSQLICFSNRDCYQSIKSYNFDKNSNFIFPIKLLTNSTQIWNIDIWWSNHDLCTTHFISTFTSVSGLTVWGLLSLLFIENNSLGVGVIQNSLITSFVTFLFQLYSKLI